MIGYAAVAIWLGALIPTITAPGLARTYLPLFMCALAGAVTLSMIWAFGRFGCKSNHAREVSMYWLGRAQEERLTETGQGDRAVPPAPARISFAALPRPQLIAAAVALCVAAGVSMVWASRAASSPAPPVRQQPIVLPPTVAHESLTGRFLPQRKTLEYGKANGIVASPATRPRPPRKAERAEVVRVRLTVPIVQKVAPLRLRHTLRRDEPVQATAGALLQPVGDLLD